MLIYQAHWVHSSDSNCLEAAQSRLYFQMGNEGLWGELENAQLGGLAWLPSL
jgi:hypothetical protein